MNNINRGGFRVAPQHKGIHKMIKSVASHIVLNNRVIAFTGNKRQAFNHFRKLKHESPLNNIEWYMSPNASKYNIGDMYDA